MTKTNALIESKCQYYFRVHVVLYHKEPEPMLKMVYKERKLSVGALLPKKANARY